MIRKFLKIIGCSVTLLVGISVGCAAPPYVPAPVQNFTGVAWDRSPDATVTVYVVHVYPQGATSWSNAVVTVTNGAPGILTNYPNGSAFCVTAINPAGESLPSNQITNIVNVAPAPPGALIAK